MKRSNEEQVEIILRHWATRDMVWLSDQTGLTGKQLSGVVKRLRKKLKDNGYDADNILPKKNPSSLYDNVINKVLKK